MTDESNAHRRAREANAAAGEPIDDAAPDEEESAPGSPCPKERFSPEFEAKKFKPGRSGNPRGRPKRKPTIEHDLKAALERALNKKVTLTEGDRKRVITKGVAGMEKLVHQYAMGDRHARRDVFDYAVRFGIDIFAQNKSLVEEALTTDHEAILDGYFARRMGAEILPEWTAPVLAPPELLGDDANGEDEDAPVKAGR